MLSRSAPPIRKSPLRRSPPPRRLTRPRPESARGRARRRTWSSITREAIDAAGGRCLIEVPGVCAGRAVAGHHRLPRGRGGKDTRENCLPVCDPCHMHAHDHTTWAEAQGFILSASPALHGIEVPSCP